MNPIIEWLLKEYFLFLQELPQFLGYYNLRDRIPFYALLSYLLNKNSRNLFSILCTDSLIAGLCSVGILTVYNILSGNPRDTLTGFNWNYAAPIQYIMQIALITYIGLKTTKNMPYSLALGFNGAAATGYIYEMPYWVFSVKRVQAHFLHASSRYIFYIDFQIISIGVYLWLLREQNVKFNNKDLLGFLISFSISILLASLMYVIRHQIIARIPMILYFIYLARKLEVSKK